MYCLDSKSIVFHEHDNLLLPNMTSSLESVILMKISIWPSWNQIYKCYHMSTVPEEMYKCLLLCVAKQADLTILMLTSR